MYIFNSLCRHLVAIEFNITVFFFFFFFNMYKEKINIVYTQHKKIYPIYILVYFKISLHVEMFVKCCDLSLFDIICRVWGLMLISTFSRLVLHFGGEQKKNSIEQQYKMRETINWLFYN